MIKAEYKPYLIVFLLFGLHFLSGYPGGMSPDTFDQFGQSLALKFNSHHPPVMAMVWSLFHKIYPGPQTMLFFHLLLLWGGVLILYFSNPDNKYKWMYFIIPFIPNVLSQSTMIWKDIGFGLCFFFVTSVCIFYTYQQKKAPIYVTILLLFISFYGMAIKFQAQFIVPLLVYWIISISTDKSLQMKLLYSAIGCVFLIYSNLAIIGRYSINTNSWQIRQVFDLAGIVYQTDDEKLFPEYIRESEIYSFEKVKKYYTPKWVDPLFFMRNQKFLLLLLTRKI